MDLTARLNRCLEIPQADMTPRVVKPLRQALTDFAGQLLAECAPGLALDEILESLREPQACQRAASRTPRSSRPIDEDSLRSLLASRLLEERFWEAPSEARFYQCLAAYPPLEAYLLAMEALGLLELKAPSPDLVIEPGGHFAVGPRLATRAVLMDTLRRLAAAYQAAFPREPVGSVAAPRGTGSPALRLWLARFAPSHGPGRWQELRLLAGAAGFLSWWKKLAGKQVGVLGRLAFWSDSQAKAKERHLDDGRFRQAELTRRTWQALLEESEKALEALLPWHLRQGLVRVQGAVDRISTSSESRSRPFACPVNHRQETLDLLGQLRTYMMQTFGLGASYQDFLEAARQAPPESSSTPASLGWDPVHRDLLLGALRSRFQARAQLNRLEEALRQQTRVATRRALVDSEISLWDRLNPWRRTPEKELSGSLGQEHQDLEREIDQLSAVVGEAFVEAARVYPPLLFHLLAGRVQEAVTGIAAECRSRTSRDDEGRQEVSYECCLCGLEAAQKAARAWGQEFLRGFGPLPGPAEMLEFWPGS